ncbi:MAG: tetratricopeptide repeat protein [Bacteroidota bacterium]
MKKIIKWSAILVVLLVLVSLVYYVKEKKNRPIVSSDELLRLALIEIREHKNYPKAIELTKQALAASPAYTDVQLTLARAYMLNKNMDSAKWHLENLLVKDNKNAQGLLYLVNISMQEKDTVSGLKYLDQYNTWYPEEREQHLKEYVLLLGHRDYKKAGIVYRSYITRFNRDTIQTAGFDYWTSKAMSERKASDPASAYSSYKKALSYQPHDTAVLQQLTHLSLQFNNSAMALKYNNELLKQDSSNRQYLVTASLIYKILQDDENAALYANKAYESNPSDQLAKKNLADMYISLANDGTMVNKIHYATLALKLIPAQKDALLYLINGYLEMRQYSSALDVINRALGYYPNDQSFIDKKISILYDSGDYQAIADYIESVLKSYPTIHNIKAYDDVALKLASGFIKQKKWNDALTIIQKGLAYNRSNKPLLEELMNVYASQNNITAAIITVDQLLMTDPNNETYLFKKSGLLEAQHLYEAAALISGALYKKHPSTETYKKAYLDQLLGAERYSSTQQDWDKAIHFYNLSNSAGAPGYFQLLYAMAAYSGKKDSLHVLALTDTALVYYPNDSLFLVKRSLAYGSVSLYPQAISISRSLLEKYPSDTMLQAMYLDQLYTAGKYYEKENKNDSAIDIFLTAYTAAPKDTFALMNLSAIYFVKKQYDSAIVYADMGLQLDSSNEYLLMKKASAHEQLKQYHSAYLAASRVLHPTNNIRDYADYLRSKTYRNQIGITHLRSFFSTGQSASVTGLQYKRRFEKGSVTGSLNYGDRPSATGIQAGVDVYYTHDSAYYSNLFINASTGKAFPYWQAGYSLFRNFKKGWEGELGIRYTGFDSLHNYTATAAVGKYLNSTWLNMRTYVTYNTKNWFQSYQLTSRQYLNDKNDYISLIGSLGNIPDDQGRNYDLNNFSGFTSKSVGLGFQKSFRYKTTLQAFFNYTNFQVSTTKKIGQYDFYITLLRNF